MVHLLFAVLLALPASSHTDVERRELAPNIAEYTYQLRVGPGPYDVIGVHRVTRESSPNVPARSERALFLAPGDIWNFRAAFLTGARPLPVFLAEHGVDVWGIDYRWTFVPASESDLAFMNDWGLEQDARDLGVALRFARQARAAGGNGFDPLFLLGWSRGGQIGYAYLDSETQLAPGLRQVRGFIPVDIYLKTDVPQLRDFACQRAQNTQAAIDAGNYANTPGGLVSLIGTLAIADPNGASFLPGLTNRQAGLLVGQATFALLGGLEPAPFYHFTGGVFDGDGNPAGLLYANEADLFAFEQAASPLQPNRELLDADLATCDATDVLFDDHLADITVPVLYIGATGGFGDYGIYTTSLLGSTDVTSLVISKLPPSQRLLDYGHADLFLANDAEQIVWTPLLNWINAR